jgi:cytochrome c-type biogenesis protein CcmE
MKSKKAKFAAGGAVILVALGYLVYGGIRDTLVYFVTPQELKAQGPGAVGKALRLGGMVERGSLAWDKETLVMTFRVTDGGATIPVTYKGIAPDLFKEGSGAVVEGRYEPDGTFRATTIMAKHSEEYAPPKEAGHPTSAERTLVKPAGGR